MKTYTVDLNRFTGEGFGLLLGDLSDLSSGQEIAVTDEGADVLVAVVIDTRPGGALIRVRWNQVLERYDPGGADPE